MFEPPRYGTRLVDAGLEIRLKSPMISEMVLWEWEIQEPRKVEEWRLPGRAPAVRTPQPGEWKDGINPGVKRCRRKRALRHGVPGAESAERSPVRSAAMVRVPAGPTSERAPCISRARATMDGSEPRVPSNGA